MRLARLKTGRETVLVSVEEGKATELAIDEGIPWVDPLRVWLAGGGRPGGRVIDLDDVSVLAPLRAPSKIIAVGLNYTDHAEETGATKPETPMLFNKSPGSIIGSGDEIVIPKDTSDEVDYEGELAVVIGTQARNVSVDAALDFVLGYTICNDVSARDAQRNDKQFFRAKSFDTFCPLGPFIVTTDEINDPQSLQIRTSVNGDLRQNSSTGNMVFSVPEIISWTSTFMTLEPGDVIATGTPAGVGTWQTPASYLKNGDLVEIQIEGIGTLSNTVRSG